MDGAGDERISSENMFPHSSGIDRKLDFLAGRLANYRMDIARIHVHAYVCVCVCVCVYAYVYVLNS